MAYWMKDVLQDLHQFCEENRLTEIQRSLSEAKKVLDEEIRLREEKLIFPEARIQKTESHAKIER